MTNSIPLCVLGAGGTSMLPLARSCSGFLLRESTAAASKGMEVMSQGHWCIRPSDPLSQSWGRSTWVRNYTTSKLGWGGGVSISPGDLWPVNFGGGTLVSSCFAILLSCVGLIISHLGPPPWKELNSVWLPLEPECAACLGRQVGPCFAALGCRRWHPSVVESKRDSPDTGTTLLISVFYFFSYHVVLFFYMSFQYPTEY